MMPHKIGNEKNITWQTISLFVIFVLVAGMYSIFMPLDETPDEASHFKLVRFIAEHQRFPTSNDERIALGDKGDASPLYHGLVALLSQHGDVSMLPVRDHLDASKIFIPYDTIPITHKIHTDDETFPFQGIILAWHLARLVSVLLGTLTLIGIYLTTRTLLPAHPYLALTTVGFVGFIPAYLLNSSAVNDDNLVIPLLTFGVYFLARIVMGDNRVRTLILLGGTVGLASITKYHALVLAIEFSLVFAALAWREKSQWRVYFRQWILAFGTFALILCGWFFAYLIRFVQVSESGLIKGVLLSLGDPTTADVSSFTFFSGIKSLGWIVPLFQSFWLVTGALLVALPDYIYFILLGFILLAVVGWLLPAKKTAIITKNHPAQIVMMLLLALHLLIYIGIVYGRYQIFLADHNIAPIYSAQGRHIFPAIISIAILAVLGWRNVLHILMPNRRNIDQILAYTLTGLMLCFSVFSFWFFVYPIYQPYLPIATLDSARYQPAESVEKQISDNGMYLTGYDTQWVDKGKMLKATLYWKTNTEFSVDNLIQLCLQDTDTDVICTLTHPADGVYPTRAWQTDYELRDVHFVPIPACLPTGDYNLTVESFAPGSEHKLSTRLGQVHMSGLSSELETMQICTGGECYRQGEIEISQIRQSVTLLDYGTTPAQFPNVVFQNETDQNNWMPKSAETVYQCSKQQFVRSASYLAEARQSPGHYSLRLNDVLDDTFSVKLKTRLRNYNTAPNPQYPTHITFADQLDLLGYNLDLSPHFPDEPIQIESYWQSKTPMNRNYNLAFHLLDHAQSTQAFVDYPLGGLYPNVLWMPDEYTSDARNIDVGAVSAGWHTLELRLYDRQQADFQSLAITNSDQNTDSTNLTLGKIRIFDVSHGKNPAHAEFANLGESIQLLGYDIESPQIQPGGTLSFALYWQSSKKPETDYTVFTQLIGPDNMLWSQKDNQPQHSNYPTSTWLDTDEIVDRYQLDIPSDAPMGAYRLLVGMYDLSSGERLPTTNIDGNRLPNDAIELTVINVEF